MMRARRVRSQRGASLILVLALVAFLGVIVPALLGLALTGSRATTPVVEDRKELYAASSAIDAAVQLGVEDPDVGVPGGPCPESVTTIDGFEVTVSCGQHAAPTDGCRFLDRFVTFVAEARKTSGGPVIGTVYADVVYRFNISGDPSVEVRRWSNDGDVASTLSTTTLPPCATTTSVPTSTTTTSTTTTTTTTTTPPVPTSSTTTTTAPAGGAFTLWENPVGVKVNGNSGNWRGEGTVLVTDQNGAPLNGAKVAVQFRYRVEGSTTWVNDDSITFDTTVTGRATVYSPEYKKNQNVDQVEMTITGLTEVGGRTWVDTAHALTVQVARP